LEVAFSRRRCCSRACSVRTMPSCRAVTDLPAKPPKDWRRRCASLGRDEATVRPAYAIGSEELRLADADLRAPDAASRARPATSASATTPIHHGLGRRNALGGAGGNASIAPKKFATGRRPRHSAARRARRRATPCPFASAAIRQLVDDELESSAYVRSTATVVGMDGTRTEHRFAPGRVDRMITPSRGRSHRRRPRRRTSSPVSSAMYAATHRSPEVALRDFGLGRACRMSGTAAHRQRADHRRDVVAVRAGAENMV